MTSVTKVNSDTFRNQRRIWKPVDHLNYFCQNALSQIFGWVLNAPLETIYRKTSISKLAVVFFFICLFEGHLFEGRGIELNEEDSISEVFL